MHSRMRAFRRQARLEQGFTRVQAVRRCGERAEERGSLDYPTLQPAQYALVTNACDGLMHVKQTDAKDN